jgi:hypothetical protein
MSKRWTIILMGTASILAFWAILSAQAFSPTSLTGLVVLGALAFLIAIWVGRSPTRSITQVLDDVEAEPMVAAVATMHKQAIHFKGDQLR